MILGITTIDRCEVEPIEGTRNYLEQTLESLFRPYVEDVEVVLFDSGSKQIDFIEKCIDRWEFLSLEVAPTRYTLMKNTNVALSKLLQMSDDEWIFFGQDDIIYMKHVLNALPRIMEKAPADAGMLSFVTPYSLCDKGRKMFVAYHKECLYNLGLIALKRDILERWFDSNEYKNAMYYTRHINCFLSRWVEAVSKIYAYDPNLGKHIGAISANGYTSLFKDVPCFLNGPFYGEDYDALSIVGEDT